MSKHKYKVEMVAHGATLAEAFDRMGEMMDVEYAYPVQHCRVGSYGWVSVTVKDDDNQTEEKPYYDELEY